MLKLDQLTSLRFFAAFAIVLHHLEGLFSIKGTHDLAYGVSFFFILSGFILTYSYKSFQSNKEIILFFKARFARIFPVYLFSFILVINMVPMTINIQTVIPYLFMVQGWIPDINYFFSYNGPAWSISTEFFFYLLFPFLLILINKSIWKPILFGLFLLITMLYISSYFPTLSEAAHPTKDFSGINFSKHGLLYINPLSRIFEFIVGMSIAVIFRNPIKINSSNEFTLFSILEFTVLFLVIFCTIYGKSFLLDLNLHDSLIFYYSVVGPILPFAIFILIFAHGKGLLSEILKLRFFVFLGEISFTMYLIHQILIRYYVTYSDQFIVLNNISSFLIYSSILVISSYLIWSYIEVPFRKLILGKQKIHGNIATIHLNLISSISLKLVVDVAIFLLLVFIMNYIHLERFKWFLL